jgi:ABC-type Fe3+ transport system permease subunit
LLVVAPLAIPAFVQSYAWVSVIPSLHGLAAAVFISVLAYYPFIYMPVAAVLRRLDPNLEDVAASLGIAPWQVFFRVVLPQLKLAIWGGALLVGLHLLAEYGLYVMIRFDTFTTAIYDQFQSTFSGPAANMLAGVLALCCLGLLLLEGATRGKARYARVGEAPPAVRISMHPQWQVICWDNFCWPAWSCWRWERPSRCWGAGCGRAAWRSGRTVICGYLCIKRWSWRRPGHSLPLALLFRARGWRFAIRVACSGCWKA